MECDWRNKPSRSSDQFNVKRTVAFVAFDFPKLHTAKFAFHRINGWLTLNIQCAVQMVHVKYCTVQMSAVTLQQHVSHDRKSDNGAKTPHKLTLLNDFIFKIF